MNLEGEIMNTELHVDQAVKRALSERGHTDSSGFNNVRYFISQWGYVHEIWQNACGCCPFAVLYKNEFHHSKRGIDRNGISLSFKDQSQIDERIERNKLEELL